MATSKRAQKKVASLADARAEREPWWEVSERGVRRFSAPGMGAYLAGQSPFALGGEELFVYTDGAYRGGGERYVRRQVNMLTGSAWRSGYADETVKWLWSSAPPLDEHPPPDLIRVANGILKVGIRGARLLPPGPEPRTPAHLPVVYDPDAKCPGVMAYLKAAQPDPAVRATLLEIAGYLLTADNRQQRAFMLIGEGGTGKSTFIGLLRALLGGHNVSARELRKLDEDRFAAADLYGKLANLCADISSSDLRATGVFKQITGGDAITAERKYRPAFSFKPYARLMFSANEVPGTHDATDAFFDRWLIVRFDRAFRGTAAEDTGLLAKLTAPQELSGLLNEALAGLVRLRRRGRFDPPPAVRAAGAHFRAEADSIAAWAEDQPPAQGEIPRSELHGLYADWCRKTGRQPKSDRRFYEPAVRALRRMGYEVSERKIRGTRYVMLRRR